MPDVPHSLAARLIQRAWPKLRVVGDMPLGKGNSGVVWQVTDGEDDEAVKIMPFQLRTRINRGVATDARIELGREWKRIVTQGKTLKSSKWIVGINGWELIEDDGNAGKVAHAHGLVRMALWPANLHDHVVEGFGRRTARETAQLVRAVAETLDGIRQAHEYICTDLKPENLLIRKRPDGSAHVVVGDIGGLKGLDSLTGSTQLTHRYASPEALRSDKTDLVATIFSFGLVAFFIVEGRLPYEGDAPDSDRDLAMMRVLLREHGPDFRSNLPAELAPVAAMIRRCQSEDRAQRPQSYAEVIEKLGGHEGTETIRRELTEVPRTDFHVAVESPQPKKLASARKTDRGIASGHLPPSVRQLCSAAIGNVRVRIRHLFWNAPDFAGPALEAAVYSSLPVVLYFTGALSHLAHPKLDRDTLWSAVAYIAILLIILIFPNGFVDIDRHNFKYRVRIIDGFVDLSAVLFASGILTLLKVIVMIVALFFFVGRNLPSNATFHYFVFVQDYVFLLFQVGVSAYILMEHSALPLFGRGTVIATLVASLYIFSLRDPVVIFFLLIVVSAVLLAIDMLCLWLYLRSRW